MCFSSASDSGLPCAGLLLGAPPRPTIRAIPTFRLSVLYKSLGIYIKGILAYATATLVSIDYNGSTMSSSLDSELTQVVGETLVKVISWYDNESGYSQRMLDLTAYMAEHSA